MDAKATYQALLTDLFVRYATMVDENKAEWTLDVPYCTADSIKKLCTEAIINTAEYPEDKLNRWLGFVQGILIVQGFTTVEAERNFTRPLFKAVHLDLNMKSYDSNGTEFQ